MIGFNVYFGLGEVIGEIVYVNCGIKEDFECFEEMGIDVDGCIVIVCYGGNFCGYKVKFVEVVGVIGLIIYIDFDDFGYC